MKGWSSISSEILGYCGIKGSIDGEEKNLRRVYMDELVRGGEYFSKEAMRERKPYFSTSVSEVARSRRDEDAPARGAVVGGAHEASGGGDIGFED
ncbi:hypothetical protein QJS10_CPB19g01587 [Acorus calamus]|uniref:CCD97-like C-terminal domain-containing protein n=1 Tax=Acorus calamus TaxID=4465 RepID=A0AAV9CJ85_ACOCL|nr:hypothetical protein QJS10_CPB19g01587 [Acorus calamus]